MSDAAKCPECQCEDCYADGNMWVCPLCAHEWSRFAEEKPAEDVPDGLIRDAHGNVLSDGDAVSVIKDLKVKGSSSVVKVGTKVKSIRLVESDDGHNIACKIEGIGSINLKSEFVKKT